MPQWQGYALISFSVSYMGNPAFVNVGNMAIHYFLGYGKSQFFPVNRDGLTSTQIWKSGAPEKNQSESACWKGETYPFTKKKTSTQATPSKQPCCEKRKGISKPTWAPIPNQTNKKLHWPDGNWAYVKLWNERDGLASNGWGWIRSNGNFWNHDQVQLVEMPLIQRVGIGYQMPPRGCML